MHYNIIGRAPRTSSMLIFSAFAALLGGIERLEDMRLDFGRDAHARIAD